MDIDLQELQKHYKQISEKQITSQNTQQFKEQFHNVGHLNIQSYKDKQVQRIINRFDGVSVYCCDLNYWKKISFQNNIQQQFLIKNVSFYIEKQKLNGIYSNDNTSEDLLKFLSLRQPRKTKFATFDMYIDNIKIEDQHRYQRLCSYISNKKYLDKYKTPRQIFVYFAKIQGYKQSKIFAHEIIELVGLQGSALTPLYKLNNCQYKRCQIGAELIRNPKILYLQKPFNKLIYHEVLDLISILKRLSERGLTIVFNIDKDTFQFLNYLDKIIVLDQQQKYFEGSVQKLRQVVNNLTPYELQNSNILNKFMQNIDIKRFRYLNEDINQQIYNFRMQKFTQQIQLIQQQQTQQDLQFKIEFYQNQNIQNKSDSLIQQVNQQKNKISSIKHIFIMYSFNLKTYIYIGMFQFSMIQAILISIIMIFNFIYKPNKKQISVISLQNLAGSAFVALVVFYIMGLQLSYKPLKYLNFQSRNYGLKNKLYKRSTLLIVFELLSFTQILIFGTINYLFLKIFYGNWFNVKSTIISWTLLVFATMGMAKDIAFFMVFFYSKKTYFDIGAVVFFINILFLGYLVQIKSIGWYIKWIAFLIPLRIVYQGVLLNAFQRVKSYEDLCNIKNPLAQSQFCSPLVYQDYYENTITLNFVVFIIVFICYKLVFIIMFYIWSKKKSVKKVQNIL